jgi:uncharacterized glyoxalase superfamily protein PhnB
MEGKMIIPVLSVADVDASVKFYTEKLGFTQEFAFPGPDGKNTFASVKLGEAHVMVGTDSDLNSVGKGVEFMIYIPDDADIDDYYAQTQARGAEIAKELKTAYWGDRVFTVNDPDGYVISLTKTVQHVPMEEIEAVISGAAAK